MPVILNPPVDGNVATNAKQNVQISRGERAKVLLGAGRRWLKAGQDPITDLIKERAAEDATCDVSA